MDLDDSWGLLKGIFRYFAQKPPEKVTPSTSLRSQTLDAWMRADAYVQYETNDFDEIDLEHVARTLRSFENLVQCDIDQEQDSAVKQRLHHTGAYPKLQAIRRMVQRLNHDAHLDSGSTVRISKRKRDNDAAIEEISRLDIEAKKRRPLSREEPNVGDDIGESEADFAILMRKHSVSLHQGLRTHWTCVCRRCLSLSVRLSLPQRKKSSEMETCFEVFFGLRSLLAITLQEAKITVKDVQNDKFMSRPELAPSVLPEFAHICQSITESLNQRYCLNLLFEDGLFKRLRPQPIAFGGSQTPQTVSLSALFKRQQELRRGLSVLPLKGKRILAVTLAIALLPFLETPWLQPSFNHSKIQFIRPLQDGELPNITKPFLVMEQVPIIWGNRMDTGNGQAEPAGSKHMIHPNASVLALGILLCELHYCTPVESWQNDTETAQNVNTDYYTSLDLLKDLEADAGVDYYLATKACLQWEYFPAGEPTSFESASVQELFYQNVIKRLESEIFKSWHLRLEDLNSFTSQENALCWGVIGREVVRQQTSKPESFAGSNEELAGSSPPVSDMMSLNSTLRNQNKPIQMPIQHTQSFQNRSHIVESTKSLCFFDASHLMGSEQQIKLSERWMYRLLSSIYHHVDSFDTVMQQSAGSIENRSRTFEPVRIAILDSGYDPEHSFINDNDGLPDPRIKKTKNFVHGTDSRDVQDKIGHGTHALGLLLKVATCAEIYIAKVANQETLSCDSYDAIAKARLAPYRNKFLHMLMARQAINYAVTEWNVDIISMSFGIREYHEPMKKAISNASYNQTLMFAAASNDGANLGRAFPAKDPSVFCIHSTDGNGNPSAFNPTADEKNVNFCLLGEYVSSHWPARKNGHNDIVKVMSGTSVATPIAAGLAASVLSFVRQQEQDLARESDMLGPWLKDFYSMDTVLKNMVRQRRGAGYDYITPHILFDADSSREYVYNKIKDIKKHTYK